MTEKLASIIIPTYYRNDWLPRAIKSAQNQTYEDTEIIVVDDSGEGYAKEVVSQYDVRYIQHEKNEGGNPARNTGIKHAKGNYIQLLDDDDIIMPTKIEKQISVLESKSNVGVVYSGLKQSNGVSVYPKKSVKGKVLNEALQFDRLHPCQTTTMILDGNLLRKLYPLVDREAGDDLGLKIRAAAEVDFDFVNEILVEKGSSGAHRVEKVEYADEVWSMINEFNELYEGAPPHVRRNAVVFAHQSRGYRMMRQHFWSFSAIQSFAKAVYFSRLSEPHLVVAMIASIFGKVGYLPLKKINSHLNV